MAAGRLRLALALSLACLLSACGFHPLYGTPEKGQKSEESELATIRVDTIADRQGQKLRNYLIDDLQGEDVPPPAEHELLISYNEYEADLGLNNDATTTRGQLSISVSFQLKNIKTGKVEMSNSAQQITGYNIQTSEFATILSRDDAENRALRTIADNLQVRLALYFRNARLDKASKPPAADVPSKPGSATQTPAQAQPGFGAVATPFATHAPGEPLDNQSPITQTP